MDCYLACVPAAANCEVSVFNWATYSCKTGRKKAKVTKAPVPVLARVAIHNKTWPNVTTGELNKVEISHNYVLGASLCSPRELIMELLLFLEHFLPCNFMSTLIFANLFLFVRPVLCVDNSVYKRRTINHNFTWLCFTSFLVSLHGLLCYNTIIHKFYPASLKNTFIQKTYKKHTTNECKSSPLSYANSGNIFYTILPSFRKPRNFSFLTFSKTKSNDSPSWDWGKLLERGRRELTLFIPACCKKGCASQKGLSFLRLLTWGRPSQAETPRL